MKEITGNDFKISQKNLFEEIYKCPKKMPVNERLALRTAQLLALATQMENALLDETPPGFLRIYPWAVEYIATELKTTLDRLNYQRIPI